MVNLLYSNLFHVTNPIKSLRYLSYNFIKRSIKKKHKKNKKKHQNIALTEIYSFTHHTVFNSFILQQQSWRERVRVCVCIYLCTRMGVRVCV